jgi:hypothetical protein
VPVQFRRDEELPQPARELDRDNDWEGFGESLLRGVRSGMLWLALFSGLLPLLLMAMRKLLVAANELLLHDFQQHWSDVMMLAVLLAFLGAIFGGLIAWRTSSAGGLGGGVANLTGIGFCLALGGVGLVSASVILGGMLTIAWVCMGALALAGSAAVCLTNHVLD